MVLYVFHVVKLRFTAHRSSTCQLPWLIVFIAAFYYPTARSRLQNVFPRRLSASRRKHSSFGRSMVIVVDYGCAKCKGIGGFRRNRALCFVLYDVRTGCIKSCTLFREICRFRQEIFSSNFYY